jgi:hypothetical protein
MRRDVLGKIGSFTRTSQRSYYPRVWITLDPIALFSSFQMDWRMANHSYQTTLKEALMYCTSMMGHHPKLCSAAISIH